MAAMWSVTITLIYDHHKRDVFDSCDGICSTTSRRRLSPPSTSISTHHNCLEIVIICESDFCDIQVPSVLHLLTLTLMFTVLNSLSTRLVVFPCKRFSKP